MNAVVSSDSPMSCSVLSATWDCNSFVNERQGRENLCSEQQYRGERL